MDLEDFDNLIGVDEPEVSLDGDVLRGVHLADERNVFTDLGLVFGFWRTEFEINYYPVSAVSHHAIRATLL